VKYALKRDLPIGLTDVIVVISVLFSRFYLVVKKLLANFAALTRN